MVNSAHHLELAIGGYPMKSLKTAVAHAHSTCNDSAVKTRAHAMKTRTRTHIAPPPPRKSGASGIS